MGLRGVCCCMATHTWSARGHLEQLGIEHEKLTHADVVTLSYSLHGWQLEPITPAGGGPIVARVWFVAALNARGRYRAPERVGHLAELEDGGPLVDSVVLMALVQRHFLAEPADAWDDAALAAQLGLDPDDLGRAQRVLDEVQGYPLRNARPAPLGRRWWER
jgi:hypothetical protein